jgi:diguanylate cyclase (GGDEF)-like protein
MEALENELGRARRMKQPLTVMFCEAEGMQRLYRERGSSHGDQALRNLAQQLKEDCRDYDHIGRLGGERFALVLPGMKRESLGAKLQRLSEIAAQADPIGRDSITLNYGMAFYPDDGDSSKTLVGLAQHRKVRVPALVALHEGITAGPEVVAAT